MIEMTNETNETDEEKALRVRLQKMGVPHGYEIDDEVTGPDGCNSEVWFASHQARRKASLAWYKYITETFELSEEQENEINAVLQYIGDD
tara:strand:+ start:255 stop:524 length:270 start_codon:yes stop_codon:yes gene_type:complete